MIERRRFLKLMGVGTAGAVVANSLPNIPDLPPPPLPAVEEEQVAHEFLTPRKVKAMVEQVANTNPNHVTMSDIGLGLASDFKRIFG